MDEEEMVLSTGEWCLNCEFLEQSHDVMPGGCGSCGCKAADHVAVKVVKV